LCSDVCGLFYWLIGNASLIYCFILIVQSILMLSSHLHAGNDTCH